MNTLARNFSHTFRRFLTASVLNIIGLAIAFASFFVIMTQVDYDLNFNKGYKGYEKIFRAEFKGGEDRDWQTWLSRPFGEIIENSSVSNAMIWNSGYDYEVNGHLFNETTQTGFGNFIKTFQPEMIAGSADALNQEGNILIPQSMAIRFFGSTDAVGKTIFEGKQADNKPLTIGGVYKDFPENTQLGNMLLKPLDKNENKDNWNNFNYICYVRLSDATQAESIEKIVSQKLLEMKPFTGGIELKEGTPFFRLTPLSEVHFSKIGNKSASSRTTVYLLICVSFLIVIIAAINFMNFSLAETPMRIKSINTQKVLGATTGSLRTSLIMESVLVSILAFALSLVLILALRDSGVEDLVSADLSLGKHVILLIATFGISVLIGILAGLYPSFYVTSFPPALVLKGSFGLSPKGRKLRTTLVCFQFFISFMLIIAIGIMYAQSRYIRTSEYGYDKDAIIVGETTKEVKQQMNAVVDELSRISGVEGVAFSQFVLSSSDTYMSWGISEGERTMNYEVMPVDYRYLDVMGIRLTEGRNFKSTDGSGFIFNEAARKKYPWLTLNQPPFQKSMAFPVIGFCENIKFTSFRNDNDERPMAFFSTKDLGWEGWENTVNQCPRLRRNRQSGNHPFAAKGNGEVHAGTRLPFPLYGPGARQCVPQRAALHPPDIAILPARHRHQHDRRVRAHHVRERVPPQGDRHPQDIRQHHGRNPPHVQPPLPVYTDRMLHRCRSLRLVDRTALAGRIRRTHSHPCLDIPHLFPPRHRHHHDYGHGAKLEERQRESGELD